jgi:predicted transcriptional regulator
MLKFLNLIADKKFSLIELPVFLTIYMDTRYSNNGCCRTMRGFTENTPFELSLSSVFNAINSLIEKGYVKKKYNEEKDCIYYVVPDVEQEANKKIPDCALETTLSDKIQSVSEKRKEKKKNVFSPPDRQTVQENMKKYFSKRYGEVPEDFIETQTEMFFAYYEQIGWEIGRTKKKMKNVALACSGWVLRDKSFTEYKNSVNTVPALSVQPVSIEDIVREIYAIYEPMQFRQDWKNYRIENLIEEQARAFYAQMTKKNWKLNVGCQTWQDQLQVFAADMYCPLRFLNPDYVTKNKQEREARNELLTGFKNSDPFNRDSIENLKMILSR